MSENSLSIVDHAARATPEAIARRVRGLSDRAILWLFISPTMLLLLAINIFPLAWTIRLSFTNYRANRPNARLVPVGIANYVSVLTDPDVWAAMQVTAHFLYQPQIGLWNYALQFLTGVPASSFTMIGSVKLAPWAIIIVDTWMWTPYVMLI